MISGETVADFKSMIEQRAGTDRSTHRLIYEEQELEDSREIRTYHLPI
jgi:hypothetical protein